MKYFYHDFITQTTNMASMGFSRNSIEKFMTIIDDNSMEFDEKTYIELSNAAMFLFKHIDSTKISSLPPEHIQQDLQPQHQDVLMELYFYNNTSNNTSTSSNNRLCNRHKSAALWRHLSMLGYMVRVFNSRRETESNYIKELYAICISIGMTSRDIKAIYYQQLHGFH